MRRATPGAVYTLLAFTVVAAAALPGAARGDWLVTREGDRIETRGGWETRGKLVVFRLADGTLTSMRLAELDLEASLEATREAAAAAASAPAPAAAPEPAPVREPVLVLTDADVAHVAPGVASGADDEAPAAEAEGDGEPPESATPRLTIASWNESAGDEGVAIVGRVRNESGEALTAATVSVDLLDADGQLLASSDARLTATTLPPGGTATFRAEFPSVWAFFDARFQAEAFALASRPVETAPEPTIPGRDDS